jgi:hypothetical protein
MKEEGPPDSAATLLFATISRSLPAEPVEFSVPYASEESVPFVRGKTENRTFGVPAIADADPTIG